MVERLQALIEKYQSWTVIVEGNADKAALENLGFNDVWTYGMPAWKLSELLEHREVKKVLLLMDLDSAGKKKYAELKPELIRHGIQVQDAFRNYLKAKTTIVHIEGLDTYVRNQLHKV